MLRKILTNSIKLNYSIGRTLSTTIRCHNKSSEAEDYTHFGFETVKTKEKAEKGKLNFLILKFFVI